MSYKYFAFGQNSHRLISLLVGLIFLMTALPAFAQFKQRDRKPAGGYTGAGGSRSDCLSSSITVIQLAPQTFIGKTTATRPMLAWYISNAQNVRFRLFEFESPKKVKIIGTVKQIPATVGINKLKLPLEYPELTIGKTYLWQIATDCNNDTIVSGAAFTVVNPQEFSKKQFSNIPESVNYYAERELWYEALEEALKATNHGNLGTIGASLVKDLAESEILIGNETEQNNIQQRIEDMQKIASNSSK